MLRWREFSSVYMKGLVHFLIKDKAHWVKIYWRFFEIFLYKTAGPNLIELGTQSSWVKRIQISSNKGTCIFQKVNNSHIVKIYRRKRSQVETYALQFLGCPCFETQENLMLHVGISKVWNKDSKISNISLIISFWNLGFKFV